MPPAGGGGGKGALVRAVVPVKPGETLAVVAGCLANDRRGGLGIGGDGGRGFYNGGGSSAGMRREGFVVDPLVVAGGGGGGGGGAPLVDPGDSGHGSAADAGNREKVTADGASGDKGVQDFLGSFYSNGGGGSGGVRGGRGGADSSTIFDNASGGRGGSSRVTSAAELGSQIVGGGAPHGSGFIVVVPLVVGQPKPTLPAFGCRADRSIYDSFTVPAGATQMITVTKGGAGGSDRPEARGGRGATVEGVLSAIPGAQYESSALAAPPASIRRSLPAAPGPASARRPL